MLRTCVFLIQRLVVLLAALGGAVESAEAPQGFHALGGPALSEECVSGFRYFLDGKLDEAQRAFEAAAVKNAAEAPAQFGLGLLAVLRGLRQEALERISLAFSAGRQDPWAETYLEAATRQLSYCQDPKPFLDAAAAIETDAAVRPYLRDRARYARAEWLLDRGSYDEAAQAFAPLQYLSRWALIGPFDNRDKAGFDAEYDPENEVDFEKPATGRNRPVPWFWPRAEPVDGEVDLSQVFEPNTHSVVFGATHVQAAEAQWAVLRLGCAGAAKVWLNEREVARVAEYNDYAPEKAAAPVYLQKGWNQILVKSAVVEGTGWAFSVRLSKPEGGPLPGLAVDATPAAWKAYKAEGVGRPTPLLEPQEPDLGVEAKLAAALKANPRDAWLRAFHGYEMDKRKLGNKEERIATAEFVRAIEAAPGCPLFRMFLAYFSDDLNQARMAAEACLAAQPGLPLPFEDLADKALDAGLETAAEDFARKALEQFGPVRSGPCALTLAKVLRGRGRQAEAWRQATDVVARMPYLSEAWLVLADLEPTRAARRATLKKALGFCGGNPLLRRSWAEQLTAQGKEAEAAAFLEAAVPADPFAIAERVALAKVWRQAGDAARAHTQLAGARATAPENPELLIALGNEALEADKQAEAEAAFREVLRVKPNSPEVQDWLAELSKGRGLDREFFAAYDLALKDLPAPGEADFPKDQSVTLLNQEVVKVNQNGTSSKMVHMAAKLLRPGGAEDLKRHRIYYDPQRQVVDILRAAVITPSGRELARAQISDQTVSAAMGVQTRIYDEYHLKLVEFPNLEPGAVVDLQYTLRDTGDNIFGDYFSDSFYLGDDQPVLRSQQILDLPKSREFKMQPFRVGLTPERMESKDPQREVWKWEAKDLPGVIQERGMPPLLDKLPFVQTTTMKTWQEVSTWYWNLAKDSIAVDEEMKKTVAKLTADAPTATEKLRAIHDWAIAKIRYLGIEFGRNGYKPHRATETFKALYGDCKDTATLITALCQAAGIESRLVLIRTVDAGRIEEDCLPAPNLFNHCIAYIPNVDGKEYWIDGTTDYHQLGEVPYNDQGAQVLVVGPDGGKFVCIPRGTAEENQEELKVSAQVAKDGSGTVFIRNVYRGQRAPWVRQQASTPGTFKSFLQEQAARRFPGAKLTRQGCAAPEEQGPMWVEVELEAPGLAAQSGDRKALTTSVEPLNLARGYLTGNERRHDLELWYPWGRTCETSYHLDPSFKVVAMPEEAELNESFASFSRKAAQEGNTITVRDVFILRSQRITKEEYPKFHAFCRKVDALLEQKVLLEGK